MFHSASYYFGAFGTVRLRYKTQFKTGQTDAKVRAMKSRGNFSQQRNRSTPLDSKVLVCIVLFGCIWDRLVALQNTVQNGPKWCKSLCHEVVMEFFARTYLIHRIGPLPHVSVRFVLFVCILDSLLRYHTQFKTCQTCAKFRATKSHQNFSQ